MSKKRPRITRLRTPANLGESKLDAAYWRSRLFKNTYTHEGNRFETNHWSVKIQHLGERRAFSLAAREVSAAASEACRLYRSIIREGWRSAAVLRHTGATTRSRMQKVVSPAPEQANANFWRERLIHRPYAMAPQSIVAQELSVRIAVEGINNYFPLGTEDPKLGANHALRIHRTIIEQGWRAAERRFNRELTVAFRWIDNPLAWTYTTIHTRNSTPAAPVDCEVLPQPGRVGVAIVEPDAGIRQSLAWCLNQMTGFYCAAAFKSASQAVSELPHYSLQLVLINRSLADGPGLTQLNGLKNNGREIATLIYSVYPNSETLFAATPGGAVCYLLRRRPATEFLEPIHNLTTPGSLSKKELTLAAWQYFKNIFALHPADGAGQVSTNLTQREHEVLALLSNGHPDKEIASRLGISIYTVHEHVRNIFEKLGVHSRTSAVVKYLQK